MSEGFKGTPDKGSEQNVYPLLDARIKRYNDTRPTKIGVKGDSFVYPKEVIVLSTETAIKYAQEIVDYWSIEGQEERIKARTANFPVTIDRKSVMSHKRFLRDDPFQLLILLDTEYKDKKEGRSSRLSVEYQVAIAEKFLELQNERSV